MTAFDPHFSPVRASRRRADGTPRNVATAETKITQAVVDMRSKRLVLGFVSIALGLGLGSSAAGGELSEPGALGVALATGSALSAASVLTEKRTDRKLGEIVKGYADQVGLSELDSKNMLVRTNGHDGGKKAFVRVPDPVLALRETTYFVGPLVTELSAYALMGHSQSVGQRVLETILLTGVGATIADNRHQDMERIRDAHTRIDNLAAQDSIGGPEHALPADYA